MSVRRRFTLFIGALILAVTVTFAGLAYHAIRANALAGAGRTATRVSEQLGRLLSASAAQTREAAQVIADNPVVRRWVQTGKPSPDSVLASLAPSMTLSRTRPLVVLLNPEGRVLAADSGAPAVSAYAFAAMRRELARGGPAATGPLVADSAGIYILSLAPIDTIGGPATAFAVLALHADDDDETRDALPGLVGADAVFYLANHTGDIWTDLSGPVEAPTVSAVSALSGPVVYGSATRTWVGTASPVEGTPWISFVSLPVDQVLAPAQATLKRLALFGGVLLILALLGTAALAAGLTRPLESLAVASRALGEGRYDGGVAEPRAKELAELARAFNRMAVQVRASHDALQHQMEEAQASEARLRETEERLRHVIASSNAVIYERDPSTPDARLSWISANAQRVLGHEREQLLGPRWWREHVHPDDLAELESWVAAPEPGATSRTYRLRHADGKYCWIRDERRCVPGDDGQVTEVVGAWIDVTVQHDLEMQLRQSQKLEAVGRLAGGIAHDFNNMLTVIIAEAEEARAAADPSLQPLTAALDAILAAATSASSLTRQLLTFSRREMVAVEPLDLNEMVGSLHSMLRRLVGEDLHLDLDLAEPLWPVNADRGHIEQVVTNLVVNARDATEAGGSIVLRTRNVVLDEGYAESHASGAIGDHVVVSVSDTGSGMSQEVKDHLFEPFFTTKPFGQGTGLGLATCYTIAERMGGHIGVYSEEGVGTTVRLYLPRTRGLVEQRPTRRVADEMPGGDEHVLIVEDEPSVRLVAARVLRARGYTVREASDGESALEMLRKGDLPDLILSDLVMPRMSGRELAAQVGAMHPGIRFLFMSGYTDDVVTRKDLVERGIAFIQKPFSIAALALRVREVLDGR